MEEEEEPECSAPFRRFSWQDGIVLALVFPQRLVGAVSGWWDMAADMAAGHANYSNHQREFADDVRQEIESLPERE